MEWFIGIFVIYLIWRIFFAKGTEAALIQKEIVNIYMTKPGEMYNSSLPYDTYKEYAKDRGNEELVWERGGGSISCEQQMLSGEKVLVSITKNRQNGNAIVTVEEFEKLKERLSPKK